MVFNTPYPGLGKVGANTQLILGLVKICGVNTPYSGLGKVGANTQLIHGLVKICGVNTPYPGSLYD